MNYYKCMGFFVAGGMVAGLLRWLFDFASDLFYWLVVACWLGAGISGMLEMKERYEQARNKK